jgi:hypothetical protein
MFAGRYESSVAFGMRKALQAEQGKSDMENRIVQLEGEKKVREGGEREEREERGRREGPVSKGRHTHTYTHAYIHTHAERARASACGSIVMLLCVGV